MIISHNMNAMIAYRCMLQHSSIVGKAMERLSTGLRINRAADDPAGLAISEKMRAQIRGLEQASRNAQDGISMLQVAEGALNETHSILQRMRELANQAANDTMSVQDRKNIQDEINQLTEEINSIGNNTEYNTMKLFDSSIKSSDGVTSEIVLQVGSNQGQTMIVKLDDMRAKALNVSGESGGTVTSEDGTVTAKFTKVNETNGSNVYALDVSNHENASNAIKILDDAINKVSSSRARLGATENALEYRIDYLNNTAENLTAAESRIRDADMAKEMMTFTKHNILLQVAQAMLVQANNQAKSVLELLKM